MDLARGPFFCEIQSIGETLLEKYYKRRFLLIIFKIIIDRHKNELSIIKEHLYE